MELAISQIEIAIFDNVKLWIVFVLRSASRVQMSSVYYSYVYSFLRYLENMENHDFYTLRKW